MDKNEKLQILSDLVAINSVNGNELEVAEYLQKLLQQHDIQSKIIPLENDETRANLVVELGNQKPVLAITGHMDTVAVNDDWDTNPFQMTAKDGKLYGRGVTDMKSGLAAMVIAMIELKEAGTLIPGTIRLLATAGEEVDMPGAEALEKQGYMDDVDALLIGEPSGYRIAYASKGEINITFKSQGKAAHSSMPEFGLNAAQQLIEFWNQLKADLDHKDSTVKNHILGNDVYNIDVIRGGNQANTIPAEAEALVNIRTVPEFNNQTVMDIIDKRVAAFNAEQPADGKISHEMGMNIISVEGDANSTLIPMIQKLVKDKVGINVPVIGIPGATDASKLLVKHPVGFNTVVFGPGKTEMAHHKNEYCDENMYLEFTELYRDLFPNYLATLAK
ncbi:ArgE/DapE family deacylase [Fructilactobacillus hinvesii]|uniref:Probable succinyl-diaminopimelate desuccinylase n=1 Tax=Fructilactobacillus hinvesii TaxID=2940300 RepID=A0ABY5BUD6_9LACO|nr:ArgE/DapE family deacylase [Fructilactobacillus hinvesii]USS88053.1 ArgE/DapE family deacylase [Fructilactobacillus hinvesii]